MHTTMGERLVRGYLSRRMEALQETIDTVPVFSKRYNAAVDELEEIEEAVSECERDQEVRHLRASEERPRALGLPSR